MNMQALTKEAVAAMIDHTNLKATATRKDICRLCEEAKTYHFASVMVNSAFTALCAELVKGTGVLVGTVAGFPLGQMSTAAKVFEAENAIADGADEIDYVVNVSDVKDGRWDLVKDEMKKIKRVSKPDLVIFVGDALTGNDAVEQAKKFNEAIDIDGVILTKADADSKGGASLSIGYVIKKPILFLGMGQGYDDIMEYDAEWMLDQLFSQDDSD